MSQQNDNLRIILKNKPTKRMSYRLKDENRKTRGLF